MKVLKIVLVIPIVMVILFPFYKKIYSSGNQTDHSAVHIIKNKDDVIKSIMNYPMPNVIARCKKDFHYSDEDMVLLEKEFKRFLILCALYKNDEGGTGMYSEDVDNLWHSFILFTKQYDNFCYTHAGHFIHHMPEINFEKSPEEREEGFKDFQTFIKHYEETFGQEVHDIWFLDSCKEDAQ